ncbi:MAG: hypothetical protein QM808_16300 [Steroidobacteraceae bacterium]
MELPNDAALSATNAQGRNSNNSITNSAQQEAARKPTLKWKRFLRAILESPKTSRELERAPVFDHVAHSTASELRKKGVSVDTEMVAIVGYCGELVRVARYSIPDVARANALKVLERA